MPGRYLKPDVRIHFNDISPIIFKKCAPKLALILSWLFKISYDKRDSPEGWKTARVQPVPKTDSKTLP